MCNYYITSNSEQLRFVTDVVYFIIQNCAESGKLMSNEQRDNYNTVFIFLRMYMLVVAISCSFYNYAAGAFTMVTNTLAATFYTVVYIKCL